MDFDLKERVRSAVDIVDIIGATLEIHPQGRNFVTRCPWHNDHRPSMTINQERQSWKCWPCDIGGDVFSFVMRRDGVDFPTAMRTLAEVAGIQIEQYTGGKRTDPGSPDDRETLLSAMKLVADDYFHQLDDPKTDDAKLARDYLASRDIDDENRKRFRIGFSPDSWDHAVNLLHRNKFSGEVAHACGAASAKLSGNGYVDMFRGRLMFPIHDLQDRPIALGGRLIPEIAKRLGDKAGGKYINGRETKLFRKSHQLYGLQLARDAIRRDGQVMVMEGYTDVVAARKSGVEPVVAVLGTALTTEHVKILKRFADRVVLVLDGDAAGKKRADEVLELFVGAEVDLRVLTLPENSDPADYIGANGRQQFESLVSSAPDALDHKLTRLTEGIDFKNDTHAVTKSVDTMLGILAKAPAGLRVDQMMLRLADRFNFRVERLEQRRTALRDQARDRARRVRKIAPAEKDVDRQTVQESPAARRPVPQKLPPITGLDLHLFEALFENPELAAGAVEAIDPAWLSSVTAKMLLSAYQDLELRGETLDGDTLLSIIENEPLKNAIVTIQSRVDARGDKVSETAATRYADVLMRYREGDQNRAIAEVGSSMLAENEEQELLEKLFEEAKLRQQSKTKF
ncbi:DNA primase [Rubripirellula obstinata]|uniref:DNA primase n=2 Tax=Rubripirellula obstinata TaxID=406547 RepID=A0A5B1CID7_9BACT|nr:DNA primase [Rubripirellula obstinata]